MNDEIEISVEDVSLPTRSAFAEIDQKGRGTGLVEGLWSYVYRWAAAHGLTMFGLFSRLFPELFTGTLAEKNKVRVDFYQTYCSARLNGCFSARSFLAKIKERHPIAGLEYLSNLCLADAVNDHLGLRRHRAWCAQCYRADAEPYDRLSWSWRSVTCCDRHETVLTDSCPACGAKQRFRGTASALSNCERCSASLVGDAPAIKPDPFMLHVARVASSLIEMGQRGALSSDCVTTFWENVSEAWILAGSSVHLSRMIGHGRSTLLSAYYCRRTPSTMLIAKITWISGISVRCLLFERQQFTKLGDPHPSWRRAQSSPRRCTPRDSDAVLMALLERFRSQPYHPVSAYDLARLGKVSGKHPSFRFPIVAELLRTHTRVAVRTQRALGTWRFCERMRMAIQQIESEGYEIGISRLGRVIQSPGILRSEGARRIRDGFLRAIRAGFRDVLITRTPPLHLQAAEKRAK